MLGGLGGLHRGLVHGADGPVEMVLGRVESETHKRGSRGGGFSTSNHKFRKIFEILEAYIE